MVHLAVDVSGMLALLASAHMMGQSARRSLFLVHPVHVVLSQNSGSMIGYDEWNSVEYFKVIKRLLRVLR